MIRTSALRTIERPFLAALLLAAATEAFAQQDVEGSRDHPLFNRLAGYFIEDHFVPADRAQLRRRRGDVRREGGLRKPGRRRSLHHDPARQGGLAGDREAMMKAHPELRVAVEGHTDNVGAPAANKALSDQRARSVVAAITAQGVPAARLTAAGFGQDKSVADNASEDGRAKNRRVELVRR